MNPSPAVRRLAAPLALVAAVFLLYAQTAGHAFVGYDTGPYLTENAHVRTGFSAENLRWALTSFDAANWHPLTWLSHQLDVALFGLAPAGHHLENAAWHAANALLVLALFARLGLARPFAFAGALFFAIHPLRAESVAWIVERKDLLSTFFGLASLLGWLSWKREPRAPILVAAFALYAASLASKGMFVTLPCLLLLLEGWPLGRTSLRPRRGDLATLGFAVLALGCCVLTVRAQSAGGAIGGLQVFPLGLRIANALDAWVWYLGHTLWPGSLACYYPWNPAALTPARLVLDAALLATLTAGAIALRKRLPEVFAGWLWFLGTLVPVIGLVQVGAAAHADRYTYFPALGLAWALAALGQRFVGTRTLAWIGIPLALALSSASARQIGTWRDTEVLAKHALEVTGENLAACDLLGAYYERVGRAQEALPYLREAVRLAPQDAIALSNLGGALVRARDYEGARPLLARACELAPARWQGWSLLGAAELGLQHFRAALEAFDRALELQPGERGTLVNRGIALEALRAGSPPRDR